MSPHKRRLAGEETRDVLLNWNKGSKIAERLGGAILAIEGFKSIDPIHPLGGPDGLKDLVCNKGGKNFIVAAYFPRGQKKIKQIQDKFKEDFKGIDKNKADGFIFVTNQHLTNGERKKISNDKEGIIEIYHLERLINILNSPVAYGVRLEFLDIELTKEEQLAFFAERDKSIENIKATLVQLKEYLNKPNTGSGISKEELNSFNFVLEDIVGSSVLSSSYGVSPIDRLRVPLEDLKQFQELLGRIVGGMNIYLASGDYAPINRLQVPIQELREFMQILERIVVGSSGNFGLGPDVFPLINKLNVPLVELKEFEATIDRILIKQSQLKSL
jgi:hypothetical protein